MVEVGVAVRVRGGDVADGVAGGVVEEGAVWPMIGAVGFPVVVLVQVVVSNSELSDCILVNKRTMIGQQISLPRSYIVAYNPPGVRRYVKRSRQHVMLDIAKRQAVPSAARSNQDSAILIPAV